MWEEEVAKSKVVGQELKEHRKKCQDLLAHLPCTPDDIRRLWPTSMGRDQSYLVIYRHEGKLLPFLIMDEETMEEEGFFLREAMLYVESLLDVDDVLGVDSLRTDINPHEEFEWEARIRRHQAKSMYGLDAVFLYDDYCAYILSNPCFVKSYNVRLQNYDPIGFFD